MNVALIPARGGSKSIPLKNIKEIAGKPLIWYAIRAACACTQIDEIYVSTDSKQIASVVHSFGFDKVSVVSRSAESATDTATTESVMLEFAKERSFDNIVLIQATSPMLRAENLEEGWVLFDDESVDSVLSVVKQKRFLWDIRKNGDAVAINYDIFNRPMRQNFRGYFVENGAFYITSREALLQSCNRISGRIAVCEMPEETYFEIDEMRDWDIVENQIKKREKHKGVESSIKMFLTDCDGCLTDGGMYYSENGDELKKFNTKDGYAFQRLREQGILTGIITSEERLLNRRRADKLGIEILEQGVTDKVKKIKQLCDYYRIATDEVLYIGDDLNDVAAIQLVGFGCCPADAVEEVKGVAWYIARSIGGTGVIREVADRILNAEIP